ncbi:branched-chain-amino-acid aminotransferase 2, chloroplastic-like [Silene latifolia]|uniref:branched-chain-amino-acid aminotransferase 2, chloroplastic-like n=1 Tax=Silene latifolia TaxID=37657 RepID=UPI003D778428
MVIMRSTWLSNLKKSLRLRPPSKRMQYGAQYGFTSQAASPAYSHVGNEEEYADMDWDNLGFSLTPTDFMYAMKCTQGNNFTEGKLHPFGTIELSPCSAVLNYGQGIFEGMKAMRREDGRIVLFRPDENALRLQVGAERMCMPSPSVHHFLNAVKLTTLANKRWIPPPGKGTLYMRPMLLGTGSILGVGPAPEYTFLTYASPVGNYFQEGTTALNLYVEAEYDRASPGGTGGIKTISNYGPALKPLIRAKSRGFSDVLYLDSVHGKYIEEVSAGNVFLVKGNTISTPPATGTILPGITRKSIIEIASDLGYQVEERPITINELLRGDEVFGTGTAVVVAPVGSVTYKGERVEYQTGDNSVSKRLLSTYMGIQNGLIEDKKGWVMEIY